MQKSVIVTGHWNSEGTWKDTTEKLNGYLLEGYKVVSATPMGAFGYGFGYSANGWNNSETSESDHGFASLVIIEKKD